MQSESHPIELHKLGKSYGSVEVLRNIDLRIEPGEFLVLVGPSGCGKSTLLRCIAGLENITTGTLELAGERANDVAPKDRDLAMVFQSYALYPHMTVGENMAFSLRVRKMSSGDIEERVSEAATRLGLTHLLARLPKELSGGQRQRVAVGRAIVRQPRAFLFDEPLSNLDASLRTQLRVELRKLHQELKTTMIYVTHDQVEAMTLADRIAVLKDGVLQQVGTPSELFEAPTNRFVAGFIGTPGMNFLENVSVDDDGGIQATAFSVNPGTIQDSACGRKITIGFRATALSVEDAGAARIKGRVEVVEVLGASAHVHVTVDSNAIVAQLSAPAAKAFAPGQEISLSMEASSLHLFEPETGEALLGREL